MAKSDAFEAFEPSSATSSSWQPFLWELEERESKFAKIQLAGPLTAQWALRLKDGSNINRHPEVATQIYRLVLARALAMCRRLQSGGIQPILYLDEPGLYGFTPSDPRHALGLQELKILIQAVRKENVFVGLHCCSNTDWNMVLQLGLDIISIDTELSLAEVLRHPELINKFLNTGGRFSLGVISTSRSSEAELRAIQPEALFIELLEIFARSLGSQSNTMARQILTEALYTPACGLALRSTSEAELILASLIDFKKFVATALPRTLP